MLLVDTLCSTHHYMSAQFTSGVVRSITISVFWSGVSFNVPSSDNRCIIENACIHIFPRIIPARKMARYCGWVDEGASGSAIVKGGDQYAGAQSEGSDYVRVRVTIKFVIPSLFRIVYKMLSIHLSQDVLAGSFQ